MAPRPIIFDTDPGVDDALALMLALASPELDVLGVCTVNGNVPIEVCTRNALGLLQLFQHSDIPVYEGANKPLVRDAVFATDVHGPEGMGAVVLPETHADIEGDATSFLIHQLTERPNEVTVIAVGPLTNLALAEKAVPGILKNAKEIIAMGGALVAPGNASATAEFNFFADPHAAQNVIRSGAKLTLVPLDATQQVGLSETVIRERIAPLGTPLSQFVTDAVINVLEYGERLGRDAVVHLHDPLAVGVSIWPSLFDCLQFYLDVETEGQLTLGQLVSDRRQAPAEGRIGYPVRCVMGVQAQEFLRLFLARTLDIQAEQSI